MQVIPVFFLDVDEPLRVSSLEAIAENGDAPEYVKACMKELMAAKMDPYVVPYIQVFPNPEGWRKGWAVRNGA
jgi:hypothetical protein